MHTYARTLRTAHNRLAMSASLVWIITGTSSGIGRQLVLSALRRGDKVIASARERSLGHLEDLKQLGADVLKLDVTAPLDELRDCAATAVAIHGRVDVVVNNAGSFPAVGAVEEISSEETFDQFNVGLFGALNVARTFLPYMRQQRSGKIIWVGSVRGWDCAINFGMYTAVKHAMRGLSTCLDAEIEPFGLRSICVEPGRFRSEILNPNKRRPYENRIEDYKETLTAANNRLTEVHGKQPGDTHKLCELIVDVVRGEGAAAGKPLPRSLPVGSDCYNAVKKTLTETLETLEDWKEAIVSTDLAVDV